MIGNFNKPKLLFKITDKSNYWLSRLSRATKGIPLLIIKVFLKYVAIKITGTRHLKFTWQKQVYRKK